MEDRHKRHYHQVAINIALHRKRWAYDCQKLGDAMIAAYDAARADTLTFSDFHDLVVDAAAREMERQEVSGEAPPRTDEQIAEAA